MDEKIPNNIQRKTGRPRKYLTIEEKKKAKKEAQRKYYEKTKDKWRQYSKDNYQKQKMLQQLNSNAITESTTGEVINIPETSLVDQQNDELTIKVKIKDYDKLKEIVSKLDKIIMSQKS